MQRRSLLKLGVGAGALLAVAGAGVSMWTPGLARDGSLSAPARELFESVARAVLEGCLPTAADELQAALQGHVLRLQASIHGLAPATRRELSDLLALLCTAPGRLALTGLRASWPEADAATTQQALQAMRTSSSSTRQQVYHALRDLTNAAWFSDASTWALLGYPGPQTI